jgi:integrase
VGGPHNPCPDGTGEDRLRCGRRDGLVSGSTAADAFAPSAVLGRARRAWGQAGLTPLGLHEARHTYASMMIGAGVNAKARPPTWAER